MLANFAMGLGVSVPCFKGGGSSGGGGGSSGEVDWPDYLKKQHERWLYSKLHDGERKSMDEALENAWDNSPYTEGYTYDPTDDIADSKRRLDEFNQLITNLDPANVWSDYYDVALAKLDLIIGDDEQARILADFASRQRDALLPAIGTFSAGMADIGAINSSAYVLGLVMLEHAYMRDVARFNSELAMQEYGRKQALVLGAVGDMVRLLTIKVDSDRTASNMTTEINRMAIVANADFLKHDLEIAAKDASWNLEIWQYGANLLASVSGGTSIPGSGTQGDLAQGPNMLGGALSGAATGAMLGGALTPAAGALMGTAIAPGVGTAVGAGVGMLAGMFGASQ